MDKGWNSRFVAYATAHGRTPEDQMSHDREAWPGGAMAGFQTWLGERWREWTDAASPPSFRARSKRDQLLYRSEHVREFDSWLAEQV